MPEGKSNVIEAVQIGLASSEKIREWSYGEVKKPETINYRTLKPEKEGLFCERIFGPQKDWECYCGRYKRIRYKGIVCEKCGVEVTRAKVRRERMGHIELAAPVSHVLYLKGAPGRMGLLLDMNSKDLEKVIYFAYFIVIDPKDTDLTYKQLLSDREYKEAVEKFGPDSFRAGMGAEAIKELLTHVDTEKEAEELRKIINTASGQKKNSAVKRLETIEAFRKSSNKPEWVILDAIPVIPPDLRPMVQLDGGRFATSDLNDLYRRVINRNNRLKKLLELKAPDIIVRNEKRMLQEAVDALIDNGKRGKAITGPGNRKLKSLSDLLEGKQGRFRQNLLGKRVDYSGRSVIVVGPELKMYQCGLPKEMAIELFKPFVMRELVERSIAHNIKSAKRMVERLRPEVWDVLESVIKDHPVLLNRAPTLHRLGIQAFEPVLVEGRALKLHPLVCTAYNADFDGDQMAVHVPLSVEALAEARFLMLSANNILKPQDGKPVVSPTQDMVIGAYYLTIIRDKAKGEGMMFKDEMEARMAYELGHISLQSKVKVRRKKEINGKLETKVIDTTIGKLLFNEAIPQDLGFIDRSNGDWYTPEINCLVDKSFLGKIVDTCFRVHGTTKTVEMLDKIKALGYRYSTKAAITVAISDVTVPEEKKTIIAAAENEVKDIEKQFKRGFLSDEERHKNVIKVWERTTDDVTNALMNGMDKFNNIYMMAKSGARGSTKQIRQLAGMRGLMSDPNGETLEIPIIANFREGLSILEFFNSSHGARKGLADTALRTADSGYLTRRLVDVSQYVVVREHDCCKHHSGPVKGIWVGHIYKDKDHKEKIEDIADRIVNRYAIEDVVDPKTKEVIVKGDTMITLEQAKKISALGIEKVYIRSVMTCKSEHGVCQKCYGSNLAIGGLVGIGEAVGIIAAQSIGEPGTQLTMRTFHTGGVAGGDITNGLPRVQELFEARKPKGIATITEISGTVSINETKGKKEVTVTGENGNSETYLIPFGGRIIVNDGDFIEAGDNITEGPVDPHDILKIKGIVGVQNYIIKEVQSVYRQQGVEINDKHIEVVLRQMLRKVLIEDAGDSDLLPGEMVDIYKFDKENEKVIANGGKPAIAKRTLLSITKAALSTDSFLSAVSFQETAKKLVDAAIKNKIDYLFGLKENVMVGKLIPAGTGMRQYTGVEIEKRIENPTEFSALDGFEPNENTEADTEN